MRGQGRVFHPTWTDAQTGELMVARVWALDYSINGTRHREPANTTSKTVAQRLLRQRIGDRETGKVIGRPDRVVLAEYAKGEDGKDKLVGGLRWLHETQFDLDGRRSKQRIVQCWTTWRSSSVPKRGRCRSTRRAWMRMPRPVSLRALRGRRSTTS